jgi:hypothetical protein
MKRADLIASVVLAALSVYIMIKSTELRIGWIAGEGPGGGAFSFWLALAMLICSVLIFARNLLKLSSEGKSREIFVDSEAARLILIVSGSLAAMILVMQVLGVYVSVPLFLMFYLRYLGKHSWRKTLTISLVTPVFTFILFEKLLLILLPKGITDPLFYIFF